MSIRKMKHKNQFWCEDEIYGDQMRHFISRLGSKRPEPDEIRFTDTE